MIAGTDIGWRLARLRAMGPSELAYRLGWEIKKARWRARTHWSSPPMIGMQAPHAQPLSVLPREAVSGLLFAADQILRGEHRFLGQPLPFGPTNWHRDPVSGLVAPIGFGPDINYRDAAIAGDARTLWEVNRLQHAELLAAAFCVSQDARYADALEQELSSWLNGNRFPLGINWCSSLEVGLRLIALVNIERLLGGSAAHQRLFGQGGSAWESIYCHQVFAASHWARGSSANNHLVGEATGLLVASTSWPYWRESRRWASAARRILEEEAIKQTFSDGLNREQAFGYHVFVAELLVAAGVAAERCGRPFSERFKRTVRSMVEAIPALTDVGGNLPRWGDSDDARAYRLGPDSERLASLYRIACGWLDADVPDCGLAGMAEAALLAPELAFVRSVRTPRPAPLPEAFADGGTYVLTSNRGSSDEVFILFDAGTLGYLSIAAHGHADALAFTLSAGGVPVLVDPGTYRYASDGGLRTYMRSTLAHNTLTIDRASQSLQCGPFMWRRAVGIRVLERHTDDDESRVSAEHTGYSILAGSPVHRRQLTLRRHALLVEDQVLGAGRHRLDWRLHFDPGCRVRLVDGLARATFAGGECVVTLDSRMRWHLVEPCEQGGVYSPCYNSVVRTATLEGTCEHAGLPLSMATRIEIIPRTQGGASA